MDLPFGVKEATVQQSAREALVQSELLSVPRVAPAEPQGSNPFALWSLLTPTANLEPAILAVGCELELALKGLLFSLFACREEQKEFFIGF